MPADVFRASLAWMRLRHLGHENGRLCDGGWSDRRSPPTLPVVEGEAPFDEAFAL